jgi:hypothetical protein
MDFKKSLKLSSESFNLKNTARRFGSAWMSHKQLIFILLIIVSALGGGYVWYISLYKNEWTQGEKDSYNLSQSREINLKTDLFREVVGEVDKRGAKLNSQHQPVKDIFKPY